MDNSENNLWNESEPHHEEKLIPTNGDIPLSSLDSYRFSEPLDRAQNFSAFMSAATSPPPDENCSTEQRKPRRFSSTLLFVLIFVIGLLMVPWLAEHITYALSRGQERAKADVARKLLNEIRDPEQRIPWVAKMVAPSVVGVRTISANRQGGIGMDVGSGVIVDVDGNIGYILTNNHVIENAQIVMIKMNDGRIIDEAEIVGRDEATDLAVLRVDDSHLKAIEWGDSRQMQVGDQVVAVGNPFDLGQTVTSGIISATERYNPLPSKSRIQEFLQTDAAINPGNSGGALVDLKGQLIGINTAIFSQTGGSLGIGFAIPSIMAKKVYEEIRKYGQIQHGWLGVRLDQTTGRMAEQAKLNKPSGAVIVGFFPQSPARESGMKRDDIILKWGEIEILNPLHLTHLIVLAKPGTVVAVEVARKGERIKLEVTLGTRPVELQ